MISEPFAPNYVTREGLNWSKAKEMARSPAHFKYALDHDKPDTKPMLIGRAGHCAVLEPDRFPLDYTVWKGRRAGKEYDAFCEANADRSILTTAEYETCLAMRDAVRSHPVAARYLAAGKAEQSITWIDPLTGIRCKGRLDFVSDFGGALVDLKTTANLDPPWFASRVARLMYHGQLAFYLGGLREAHGLELAPRIIAVESQPPHDVAVFTLDEDVMWAGQELAMDLLRKVAEHTASGVWPGRVPEETGLTLPAWAFPAGEESSFTVSSEAEG